MKYLKLYEEFILLLEKKLSNEQYKKLYLSLKKKLTPESQKHLDQLVSDVTKGYRDFQFYDSFYHFVNLSIKYFRKDFFKSNMLLISFFFF